MKTAIIIHGWPQKEEYYDINVSSPSNMHWLPWIQRQLLLKDILAQTPEMPKAYMPHYEDWKSTFEQFNIDEETILIGHSCGGGFLVRWLSENNIKVGQVILVAPWINPMYPTKIPREMFEPEFFTFDIDENLASKTAGVKIMYSTDDHAEVLESIKILKSKLKNVEFQEFTGKRHFTFKSMQTDKFPELLANIII